MKKHWTIGEALKCERFRQKRMQIEVGKAAGLRKSTMCMLENDYRKPSVSQLHAICSALGVSMDEIVSRVKLP